MNGYRLKHPLDPGISRPHKLDAHKEWLLARINDWAFMSREERAERIYNALNIRVSGVTVANWYKKVSSLTGPSGGACLASGTVPPNLAPVMKNSFCIQNDVRNLMTTYRYAHSYTEHEQRDLQQQFCLKMLDFYRRSPKVEFIFIDDSSCDPWRQVQSKTWMSPN